MRRYLLVWLLIVPALIGMAGFGYGSWLDWGLLRQDYVYYRAVSAGSASFQKVFVAESAQNIHRINLFADGTWFLLAGVIFAIGLHGLCLLPKPAAGATVGVGK